MELRAYQQKNKITIVDYSSKKQPAPILLNYFFPRCFCFAFVSSACFRVTPGCPERLVWCSPAAPCSPGSGTGPGVCTCLSTYSHKCQSSVHSLVPVRWKKPTKKQTIRGDTATTYFLQDIAGKVWETGRQQGRKERITTRKGWFGHTIPLKFSFSYCCECLRLSLR